MDASILGTTNFAHLAPPLLSSIYHRIVMAIWSECMTEGAKLRIDAVQDDASWDGSKASGLERLMMR